MNINEIVLLTIYAVASANGKSGGKVSKNIPMLLNMNEEDIQEKVKYFDSIVYELNKYPSEVIEAVKSIAGSIIYVDGEVKESEVHLINKLTKKIDSKPDSVISKIIQFILEMSEEEQVEMENIDMIVHEIKQYPQEVIEAIISITNFILLTDGKITETESDLIIKLRALLK